MTSRNRLALLAIGLAVLAAGPLMAEDANEAWLLQTNLLERTSKSAAGLPEVLILGDSISLGYTPAVKAKLAGKANVSRPGCNCGPSQFYLRSMNDWVGTNHWAVIHVNFGIWDNHYLKGAADGMGLFWGHELKDQVFSPVAKGTAIRDLGFRIRTPIREYERNLRTILTFLKSRADVVVFGLTTPLKLWESDDRCGRIRVYNELAVEVCKELGVAVDDLYGVAERHLDCQTDGCHFNAEGYGYLADSVVDAVLRALSDDD